MPQVGDTLDAVLLGCFLFGLLMAAASFVLGFADVGFHGHGIDHGHGEFAWLPLSSGPLLVTLTWFGGFGLILRGIGWPAPLALAVALVAGVGVGSLLQRAVRALAGAGKELRPEDDRLPGTIGRVTSSIRAGGVGEVVYEQRGTRHVTAARAHDGLPLSKGAEVVVVSYERGMATVVAMDDEVVGGGGDALPAGGDRRAR